MRCFANLYIVLFLTDAVISLVDELFKVFSWHLALFSGLRYSVACIVIICSMVIFACLGIDRRLPKRLFLPLTLYISWSALTMWPLSGVIGRESLGMVAAVGQMLLGGITMVLLRNPGGKSLLSIDWFRGPMFNWRNTLSFAAINMLLLPFVLIYTSMAIASNYLEQQTAGFMRLSPVGIYMSERSYHLDEKVIRLAGMMHIGKEDYYEDLAESMSADGTIILVEGVTDHDKLLENQFNYSELAGVIGLSSQQNMHIDGNPVDLNHLDDLVQGTEGQGKPDIASADIDLNQFDSKTVDFLNQLGRTLFSGKPMVVGLAEYNAWINENMTPERIAGVMTDILDKRNALVIDSLLRCLVRYDTIIIPWGAMHMPAIEEAVLEQGFARGVARERLSLDFRTIPYADLLRKWSSWENKKSL